MVPERYQDDTKMVSERAESVPHRYQNGTKLGAFWYQLPADVDKKASRGSTNCPIPTGQPNPL
jgi:hypothetical protein